MKRRPFFKTAATTVIVGVAGCTDPSKPARITDTQVAHGGDGRVGVMVSLRDTSPNEDAPVTVRAKLLDGGTVVAEGTKEVDMPRSDEPVNIVIWFDNVEGGREYTAEALIE